MAKTRDSKEEHNFEFKQQVLVVLMDPGSQRILRSILHTFKRIRQHQAAYTVASTSPDECMKFQQLWSNMARWLQEMVVPALQDALCSPSVMDRLLFTGEVH